MARDRRLAAVSGAQLVMGVLGTAVAVRRRRQYDFLALHGRPEHVARDAVLMGTALSAPVTMLTAQAVATVVLWRGPSRRARLAVTGLGATMISGYLGEQLVRQRLTRSGYDAVETPIVVTGLTLAVAMAVLGGHGAGAGRSLASRVRS